MTAVLIGIIVILSVALAGAAWVLHAIFTTPVGPFK